MANTLVVCFFFSLGVAKNQTKGCWFYGHAHMSERSLDSLYALSSTLTLLTAYILSLPLSFNSVCHEHSDEWTNVASVLIPAQNEQFVLTHFPSSLFAVQSQRQCALTRSVTWKIHCVDLRKSNDGGMLKVNSMVTKWIRGESFVWTLKVLVLGGKLNFIISSFLGLLLEAKEIKLSWNSHESDNISKF